MPKQKVRTQYMLNKSKNIMEQIYNALKDTQQRLWQNHYIVRLHTDYMSKMQYYNEIVPIQYSTEITPALIYIISEE
jgi:hypothetical protein